MENSRLAEPMTLQGERCSRCRQAENLRAPTHWSQKPSAFTELGYTRVRSSLCSKTFLFGSNLLQVLSRHWLLSPVSWKVSKSALVLCVFVYEESFQVPVPPMDETRGVHFCGIHSMDRVCCLFLSFRTHTAGRKGLLQET